MKSRGRAEPAALLKLSVSSSGSTGYLENRQHTHTHISPYTKHRREGKVTPHTHTHTHPLNGWSLDRDWHSHKHTHTNTRQESFLQHHQMSAGFVFKVGSCFSARCAPCAMCYMSESQLRGSSTPADTQTSVKLCLCFSL